MTKNYEQLVGKLEEFRRKYYFFQLLRGFIVAMLLLICYYSIVLIFEYFSFSSVFIRSFLFIFSLLFSIGILVWFVSIPAFRLIGLFSPMSFKKTSKLISDHFPDIQDQLINILELAEESCENHDLVWASIDQKIEAIKVIDFSSIYNFNQLRNLFFGLITATILVVFLAKIFPGLYAESAYRVAHFTKYFSKPAPFTFVLLNKDLKVKKGDALKLEIRCEGREVPEVMYINIGGSNFLMDFDGELFSYQLDQVHHSFDVFFTDLMYLSDKYHVVTLPSPSVLSYSVQIEPPAYTFYTQEIIQNAGDLNVPYGSRLRWRFKAIDTDSLLINFDDTCLIASLDKNEFYAERTAFRNEPYSVSLINSYFTNPDFLHFNIHIIPDRFPEIEVVQLADSMDYNRFYFKGLIRDDYGFHDLYFQIFTNQADSMISIPIQQNLQEQNFYFTISFRDLLHLGRHFNYHFTVSDNDYFHQYKKSSSNTFQYNILSEGELIHAVNKQYDSLEDMMEKSFQLSQELNKSIENLRFRSLNELGSEWEKQQIIQDILNRKTALEQLIDEIKGEHSDMNRLSNSFSEEKEEIVKKQQQIEELLDEVLNDELRKLFDEFNKLAQEFDQQKLDELMNNSVAPLDDLTKQLERNLQMLKRMKIEQQLENAVQLLHEISDQENFISESIKEERELEKSLQREQDNQNLIESIREEMKMSLQINESLDKPMNLFDLDREFQGISEKYLDNIEHVENMRINKASKGIGENSRLIENLGFMVQQMLDNSRVKQKREDINNLRQILDNLVFLSFKVETVLSDLRSVGFNDPLVNQLMLEQHIIRDQSSVVKDSLYALAKRTPMISGKINVELLKLEQALNQSIDFMSEGNISHSMRHEQSALTSANELALFLNEALENLEKQLSEAMPGDQECDKPGSGGKLGLNIMNDAQQSLKDQMQQLIQQMKEGNSKGLNENIGRMLAQQEMLQQMVRQAILGNEVGSSAKEQLRQIETLIEQNRLDLIQKNLTNSMVSRQNLILDKLLQAEKAEMERDIDDERESKSADEKFFSNPVKYFEYKQTEKINQQYIQYNSYKLRQFYDQKYRQYINQLND
ncbi:DUF4175 family protein [Gaoshiqia sediminis]|uniref:Uncharacterized protein n=1 Tax=Gaoshiqia sediminis TaxID=2986998 RepID=A0AA41Y5F5_9BACT|nr:DUF4175 family protein [Gaoshiqia sediminis]MCW0481462.1 hypothetical protein [Gaoshiqia sediminis]